MKNTVEAFLRLMATSVEDIIGPEGNPRQDVELPFSVLSIYLGYLLIYERKI